ncbi:hypothetical protein AX17_007481 [Amanita inopinata Kibby_2008]|nr:hypothetical protein AX17_007481 [Amanita inopinata Kibby_2008]
MHFQDFVPVSYQPDTSASDSSLDISRSIKERQNVNPMRSKLPLSPKSSIRSRRQSQIQGVPLLETQLIPSLRDTIDRMTRPPSRVASTPTLGPPARDSPHDPKNSDPAADTYRSPNFQSNSPLPSSNGPVHAVELNASRSKLTPKTKILKSVLRSPKSPSSIRTPSQDTHSPLSVKSILGKKLKSPQIQGSGSPKNRGISSKDFWPSTCNDSVQSIGRNRSCTDPGSTFQSPSRQRQPSFHQLNSSEDRELITPKMSTKLQKSSIPRPKTKRTPVAQAGSMTEDSDIELRYETENRDRRRLTVANAEVYPSSSSASGLASSTESIHKVSRPRSPAVHSGLSNVCISLRRETKWARNGLGLTFDAHVEPSAKKFRVKDTLLNHPSDIYDASESLRDSVVQETERRRAALLRIVSRLELDQPLPSRPNGKVDHEESDYSGEEGVAVSGFGIPAMKGDCTDEDDDVSQYDDDHEEDTGYRPKANDCGQASQGIPPFLITPLAETRSDIQGDTPNAPFQTNRWTDQACLEPCVDSPTAKVPSIGERSSSKSPIVRSGVIEGDSGQLSTAALKRRSIYLAVPGNPLTNDNCAAEDGSTSNDSSGYDKAETRNEPMNTDKISMVSETAAVISARARRAFGIPPSESDKIYESLEQRLHRTSLAESEFSSAGSAFWRATREDTHGGGNELSIGAASLFRELSDGGETRHEPKQNEARMTPKASVYNDHLVQRRGSLSQSLDTDDSDTVSQSSSISSVYEDDAPATVMRDSENSRRREDERCPEPGDDMETKRQEIIRSLCKSEETFVARLHVCVQLFILPLRVQNSKAWIDGVPLDVARFLDWFEDIANLHMYHIVQTLRAIQRTADQNQNIIACISEPLLALMPRLEVYQPYIVRLNSIAGIIGQMIRENGNDFGEFVTIQQRTPECGGWGLEAFLLEPMNRLTRYCDIFSRLLSLTPKQHPDYLSTFSLLQSIDVIIRVMTEVKAREDEHDLIKALVGTIQGLPANLILANRERRLLHQGRLYLTAQDRTPRLGDQSVAKPQTQSTYKERIGNRISRLASAVQAWDSRRGRSGSIKSTASSCAGLSIHSNASQNFSFETERSQSPLEAINTCNDLKAFHIFVFSDLVILATPIFENTAGAKFQLTNQIGLSRIFHAEVESDGEDESVTITLELIPLNGDLNIASMTLTTLNARPFTQWTPKRNEESLSVRQQADQWRSALQRSSQSTSRFLAYSKISSMNVHDRQDPSHFISSLVGSGLPIPKSPSAQVLDVQKGQKSDPAEREREERGWWSLRFQQVLQEMYKL